MACKTALESRVGSQNVILNHLADLTEESAAEDLGGVKYFVQMSI